MRKRFSAALLAATMAVAMLLIGPSGASAATEVGSSCTPNGAESEFTVVGLTQAAPSAGVVTQWRTVFPGGGEPLPPDLLTETLKVFRPTGSPTAFQVVGESQAGGLHSGTNTFLTRISVQPGDRFGLTGTPITLYCITGSPGDLFGYSETFSTSVGGTQQFELSSGLQVPVVAVIEPDADIDGFGDETQDKCPQSAAYQVPCPIVTISAISQPGKTAVTARIATSLDAPVQVSGVVNLGKGKKAKLSAPSKTVTAGKITSFKLNLSKALKDRLKELSPNQKLTLKISASATNVAGQVSTTSVNAKLKGQAK